MLTTWLALDRVQHYVYIECSANTGDIKHKKAHQGISKTQILMNLYDVTFEIVTDTSITVPASGVTRVGLPGGPTARVTGDTIQGATP